MSDETTLLPCPFCGGEAELHSTIPTYDSFYCCICLDCGVATRFSTEAEAIAAWNTRTDYCGYEQAAIEAWKNVKAWNTRAERHAYEQRIVGDGSDWGEIMCDAFDSLLAAACDACTFDELERLEAYIMKEMGE